MDVCGGFIGKGKPVDVTYGCVCMCVCVRESERKGCVRSVGVGVRLMWGCLGKCRGDVVVGWGLEVVGLVGE